MSIFYSALGFVLGTLYFALSGHGILVSALCCLVLSTLALTTLRKFNKEILSALLFFLLSFWTFNIRQEYFEYFAINKLKNQNLVFEVMKTKESAFFTDNIYLKPISNSFFDKYLQPKLLWKTQNFKALNVHDLIKFKDPLDYQKFSKKKINIYRKDKIFYEIKNNDFVLVGQKDKKLKRTQTAIKNYYKATLTKQNAELALGLILGSRHANIDPELLQSIRGLGLGHFFSASGFHLIILLLIIFWLCDKTIKKNKILKHFETPIAISFILFYMALIEFSPSILRAGVMASLYLIFKNSGRKIKSAKLLIILAAIILLIDPHTAFDIGFQLSYLATLGIIVWYSDINKKLETKVKIKWLREIISVSISTQIFLFPIIIYYFSNSQIWSLLANIFFTPFISLITILCFTGMSFILDPLLSFLNYIFLQAQNLPMINKIVDINLSSLFLLWILKTTLAVLSVKELDTENEENIILKFLKQKDGQIAIIASVFCLLVATNLRPFNVTEIFIKKATIQNSKYNQYFKEKKPYIYFSEGYIKFLIINKLDNIEVIKDDIQEINFLFIPKLTNDFIYLGKLIELLKPQVTCVYASSKTEPINLNLEAIARRSNTIFSDGHLYLSKNKYWKITK